MSDVRWLASDAWNVRALPVASASGRRAARTEPIVPAVFLQADGVQIEAAFEATAKQSGRRKAVEPGAPQIALDVTTGAGESALVVLRHASGALSFHAPGERRAAGGARAATAVHSFRIPVRRSAAPGAGRRGLVTHVIKAVVVKVTRPLADAALGLLLPKAARLWEQAAWKRAGRSEGWFRVERDGAALRLSPGRPPAGERSLLLVHGTFSHAAAAFKGLTTTSFFDDVRPLYGERIYAYDHFTISRTPEDNARLLLESLPDRAHALDAVTHSRGGLVLRNLVERGARFGNLAARASVRRAVLVAAPNDGTPLATPARWQDTVGWLANLVELFPDNPLSTAAEFVSEALVWIARHAAGDLPGLASMDAGGEQIAALQAPPGPPPDAYSALVANFHPDAALWQRVLDAGADQFFGSANDLVVPAEGGFRIERDGLAHVPAQRIGCYGPGGNLGDGATPVHHLNFFARPETARFLVAALQGAPHALQPIDPQRPLPDRRFSRAAEAAALAPAALSPAGALASPMASGGAAGAAPTSPAEDTDTFQLVVMAIEPAGAAAERQARGRREARPRLANVVASYAGARVVETIRLRRERGEAPTDWGRIIDYHARIKDYTDRLQGTLPSDEQMVEFGKLLFRTLFVGDVRRLYDEARSRQGGRKLDLIFTTMNSPSISWIAEKPWEFAFDTSRRSFLATEDVHFVRNVHTSIPAEPVLQRSGPLRILVAAAQPVGAGQLSIEQEVEVIRRGFDPLIEAGLVEVEVLARATPPAIHGHVSTGHYNVVHFIGHGLFDERRQEGCLLFEDTRGGSYPLGQRSIRELLCQRGIALVFLNACQSGTGSLSDFNKGVAQALVAHGLPALVANQYSVLDSSATSFAQHFYWSLAQGATLGEAAREARIAVNYSLQGDSIDWAVPVVYARDPGTRLCPSPGRRQVVPQTVVSTASRRAVAGHTLRVAVWDIDHSFPRLAATLARLNAAQAHFGFELVDLSAPLDAWDGKNEDGEPYLRAETFAQRLQSKTVELRVNALVCITRHWLRDEEWLNLYGWWPDDGQPPVAILSCAGFDELGPEGPATDRALANGLATSLAGLRAQRGTHGNRPACPFYSNDARAFAHLSGAQAFDAQCRKALVAALGAAETEALEALLGVFQPARTSRPKTRKRG